MLVVITARNRVSRCQEYMVTETSWTRNKSEARRFTVKEYAKMLRRLKKTTNYELRDVKIEEV